MIKLSSVVLVLVGLFLGGYWLVKSRTKPVEGPLNRVQSIKVKAEGGKFSPDSFKVELFDTMKLDISAGDRDYVFRVRDYPRMDVSIGKGKTGTAVIQYLGVGDYVFDCGEGCTGTITVVQERDTEGEEPN